MLFQIKNKLFQLLTDMVNNYDCTISLFIAKNKKIGSSVTIFLDKTSYCNSQLTNKWEPVLNFMNNFSIKSLALSRYG
jgi:hypothetical protein